MNFSGEIVAAVNHCPGVYDTEPALVMALVQAESEGNPWAVRYEPDPPTCSIRDWQKGGVHETR
jgi:hypothetical protein